MANWSASGTLPDLLPASDLKLGDKVYVIVPYRESTASEPWKIIRAVVNRIEAPTKRRAQTYRLEPDRELLKALDLSFNGHLPPFRREFIHRYEDEAESVKVAWSRFASPVPIPLALPVKRREPFKYLGGVGVFNLH